MRRSFCAVCSDAGCGYRITSSKELLLPAGKYVLTLYDPRTSRSCSGRIEDARYWVNVP
jgi:hypothetical protein